MAQVLDMFQKKRLGVERLISWLFEIMYIIPDVQYPKLKQAIQQLVALHFGVIKCQKVW